MGEELEQNKKESSDFDPQQTHSYFSGPKQLCKISSKSNKNLAAMTKTVGLISALSSIYF